MKKVKNLLVIALMFVFAAGFTAQQAYADTTADMLAASVNPATMPDTTANAPTYDPATASMADAPAIDLGVVEDPANIAAGLFTCTGLPSASRPCKTSTGAYGICDSTGTVCVAS